MNDDNVRPSSFSDETSRLLECVSDEENVVTGVAGAGVLFDRIESRCAVRPCRAVAVPPFFSQRCVIEVRIMRDTIELPSRKRQAMIAITGHMRRNFAQKLCAAGCARWPTGC